MRFHVIYEYPVELNKILERCHLKPEAESLLQIGPEEAAGVLTFWLHREAAYDSVLMSIESARSLAEAFLREFSDEESRLFTNGHWDNRLRELQCTHTFEWVGLTESVFDGGLLIESGAGNHTRHVCIWFEDED